MRSSLLGIFLVVASSMAVHAAVIVNAGDAVAATGTITLTEDLNFLITSPTSTDPAEVLLVFQNWVSTPDFNQSTFLLVEPINVSINGSAQSYEGHLTDNLTFTLSDMSPTDGYLYPNNPVAPKLGSIVTFFAGTYSWSGVPTVNPEIAQIFTGNMFLADGFGNRIGTLVPEPSSALLGLVGAAGLLRRRRAA